MYIKLKDGDIKQLIFCCPSMVDTILNSEIVDVQYQTLQDSMGEWRFCPYCGEKVIISEI